MNEKFKTVWVTEPGKDFSNAMEHADRIEFICNGFEKGEDRATNIKAAVARFDPATDAWIPVGRMLAVAQTGLELARAYPTAAIRIGVYREGEYTWQEM
jgi:hypothetical protein